MNKNSQEFESDLAETKRDFKHVVDVAISAKKAGKGTATNRRGQIADTLLLRSILTGLTINQALNPVVVGGLPKLSFPDFASIAVLARTTLETYLTMYNISLKPYSDDEAELRLLWWDWHEVNERIRTRDLIHSTRGEARGFDNRKKALAAKIRGHGLFAQIPDRLRRPFLKPAPPKQALFEPNRAIAKDAGIEPSHFETQYQMLSATAHSQPVIVSTLAKHDPIAPDVLSILNLSLQHATAYLAFTTQGFATLFPKARTVLDPEFRRIVTEWAGVYGTPFSPITPIP